MATIKLTIIKFDDTVTISSSNDQSHPEPIERLYSEAIKILHHHLPETNKSIIRQTKSKSKSTFEKLETVATHYPKMFFLLQRNSPYLLHNKFIFLNNYMKDGTVMGSYTTYKRDVRGFEHAIHHSRRIKITPEIHCVPPEIKNLRHGGRYMNKYLKYKLKYLEMKNKIQTGGVDAVPYQSTINCANKWFIDVAPLKPPHEQYSNKPKRWILLKDSPEFTINYLKKVPVDDRCVFKEWYALFEKFPNQIKFCKLQDSSIVINKDDCKKAILEYNPVQPQSNLYGFIHQRNENYMQLYLTIPHFRQMCKPEYRSFYQKLKQKIVAEYYTASESTVINLDIYHRVTPVYYNRGYVVLNIYHRNHAVIIEDNAFERFSRYELNDILHLYNVWDKKTFVCKVSTHVIQMPYEELQQYEYRGVECMKKLYDNQYISPNSSSQQGNGGKVGDPVIKKEINDVRHEIQKELSHNLHFVIGSNKIHDYKN